MQRQDFRLSHTWHNLGEGFMLVFMTKCQIKKIFFFIKVNRIGTKYLELFANMYNQEVTCRAIFTVLLNKRGGGQRIAVAGTK